MEPKNHAVSQPCHVVLGSNPHTTKGSIIMHDRATDLQLADALHDESGHGVAFVRFCQFVERKTGFARPSSRMMARHIYTFRTQFLLLYVSCSYYIERIHDLRSCIPKREVRSQKKGRSKSKVVCVTSVVSRDSGVMGFDACQAASENFIPTIYQKSCLCLIKFEHTMSTKKETKELLMVR